jgi:hypothetical protein
MTHLPLEDRNVWGVPGPDYEPEDVCSHPFCEEKFFDVDGYRLEKHHLWPRSFLRNQPTTWVKLPNGRIVGNIVYLCREHHRQITENIARIEWDNIRGFILRGPTANGWKIEPQPPLSQSALSEGVREETPRLHGDESPAAAGGNLGPAPSESAPHPGEDCPLCKRRVPHPKKADSPKTSVVKSWRMPAEEKEVREEIIEATAAHLGISKKEKFWFDKLILSLCVIALQGPGANE